MFGDLIFTNTLRGFDSTGMFSVSNGNDPVLAHYKRALTGPEFLCTKTFQNLFKTLNTQKFLVGHNRHATRGLVTDNNAHPFSVGKIIGVHNGTLEAFRTLAGASECTVDSEAIFTAINEVGIKEAVLDIRGSFAIVWYDKEQDNLYLLRNDKRPLFIGELFGEDTLVFGSEEKMIEMVVERQEDYFKWIEPIPAGELWTINGETLAISKEPIKLNRPYKARASSMNGYSNWPKETKVKKLTFGTKDVQDTLRELGHPIGSSVTFSFFQFLQKGPKSRHGRVRGALTASPYHVVEAAGISKAYIDEETGKGNKFFTGKVISVGINTQEQYYLILAPQIEAAALQQVETKQEAKEADEHADLGNFSLLLLAGPHGQPIPADEWDQLVENGCRKCGQEIKRIEADFVDWDSAERPAHSDCPTVLH